MHGLHNWKASQLVQDLLWHLTSAYMKNVYGQAGGRALRPGRKKLGRWNANTRSLVQLWCGVGLELAIVRFPLLIRCQGKKNGAV